MSALTYCVTHGLAVAPWMAACAVFALVVVSMPFNPLKPVVEPCSVPEHGITDERSCYYGRTGLLPNLHKQEAWPYQTHDYYKDGVAKQASGKRAHLTPLVGLAGYAAGPTVHLIDHAALTDPFLAQIPFRWKPEHHWRIGHFYRDVPDGYLQSVEARQNYVQDRCQRKLYTVVSEITQGPLLSWRRLRLIAGFNLGRYRALARPCGAGP
jgi:arabinofuranosyltransferase